MYIYIHLHTYHHSWTPGNQVVPSNQLIVVISQWPPYGSHKFPCTFGEIPPFSYIAIGPEWEVNENVEVSARVKVQLLYKASNFIGIWKL